MGRRARVTIRYPSGRVTPLAAELLLDGTQPILGYKAPSRAAEFHLMGALAPMPGVQDGVILTGPPKGFVPPWKIRSTQGSNQDGSTFNSAVYDPLEIDLPVSAFGSTPRATRQVVRDWVESWDVRQQGELFTLTEAGYLYTPVRWMKNPVDGLMMAQQCRQDFTWTAMGDDAFWRAPDSICQFPAPGTSLVSGNGTGFITLTNDGDQLGWVNHVVYGPFQQIQIANGPGSTSMIKFGPLLPNQVALLRTEPRLRGVTDLTTLPVPTQNTNLFQDIVKRIVSFASNNNVPPLLRQFESLFGILPPQGELYSLLDGRFTKPLAAKTVGIPAREQHIAVKVEGGNSATKIVSYVTPRRRWPF
ncbi:hypothetical protein SAMN04488581_2601 [Mycolicibacterium neoaurum]|uniref:hypothetical protein n=1 Tax=Mycolicibacterium neoaurum TaxID=1795 RepID=UPI00055CEAC5|nr:hypothetical protein [Mycolicibacterium neoaurum]SDD58643.1 hypothetical protein SAMN04488581_2601 [Mycolicibacterium neoaurum]